MPVNHKRVERIMREKISRTTLSVKVSRLVSLKWICMSKVVFPIRTEGEVLIDGSDIRKWELGSVRQAIGIVQQDVYLFSGSVFDNIAYGRPGADRQEVIEAAKLAGADDFITRLPEGYNTSLAGNGANVVKAVYKVGYGGFSRARGAYEGHFLSRLRCYIG